MINSEASERISNLTWWLQAKRRRSPTVRLFCFPFSGGSAASYANWHTLLPDFVEVYPAELPGRAQRFLEPGIRCFDEAVSALIPVMLPLTTLPFALFGHSMGAFLAFELARVLETSYQRRPIKLFVSGSPSPTVLRKIARRSVLTDIELIRELKRLGGTPKEVLSNSELLSLILPVIRSDFELTETYHYVPRAGLSCPVRAFAGWSDPEAAPDEVDRWRDITPASFDINLFMGEHFFLQRWAQQIASIISTDLGDITDKAHHGDLSNDVSGNCI